MRLCRVFAAVLGALAFVHAAAAAPAGTLRITRDHGGLVEEYKDRYARVRDAGQRVVIDGICNSACTLILGIVPINRVCVTPRASLGFHQAYIDKRWTAGVKIASASGTADLLTYYPPALKEWIKRVGGLTLNMKHLKNGPDLWAIIDPCPEEF